MGIYLVLTVVSGVLAYAETRLRARSRLQSLLICVLIAMLFCYFAGVRDYSVGTDVAVYGYPSYLCAKSTSFIDFFTISPFASWDPLSKTVVWAASHFGGSLFWCLAAMQAFTIVPLLWAFRNFLSEGFPFAIAVYALVFYPMSFNLMRQFMGLALLLVAYVWMLRGNIPFFCLFTLLAAGFHETCLISSLIIPLFWLASNKVASLPLKMLFLSLFSLLLLLLAPCFLALVAGCSDHYSAYANAEIMAEGGGLRPFLEIAFLYLAFSCAAYGCKRNAKTEEKACFAEAHLSLIVLFGVFTWALGLLSMWLYRIGLIFVFYAVLLLPLLVEKMPSENRKRFVFFGAAMLLLFSIDYYVIQQANEVFPYAFFAFAK